MKEKLDLTNEQELPLADKMTEERFLNLLNEFMYGAGKGLPEDESEKIKNQLAEIKKQYKFSDDFKKTLQTVVEGLLDQ